MNYIRALLLLIVVATPVAAFAQKVSVTGQVVDAETGDPLAYAQVVLYEPGQEEVYAGSVADGEGNFTLKAEPGSYELAVAYVGYEKKRLQEVVVGQQPKALGTIEVAPTSAQLETVTIKADRDRSPTKMALEGIEIDPQDMLNTAGGTALDVLRNTPSVTVSQDGTLSLRGTEGTNVLVNGRQSALATDLEQIPASAIEKIEIINNPNAKYDASAAGGVINIVLRGGEAEGTRGLAEVLVGTRWRSSATLNLSHRDIDYAIYGGYSFRNWPRIGESVMTRLTFDDDERLEQLTLTERNDREHTFNLGGDYYFGRNRLSYEGTFNLENESDFDDRSTELFTLDREELLLEYSRQNNETEDNYTIDNALIWEYQFDSARDQTIRVVASNSYRDQLEVLNVDVYNQANPSESAPISGRERSFSDEYRLTSVLQADYVQPLAGGEFEAGYKSLFRTFNTDYRYEVFEEVTGLWEDQEAISNRFRYSDQVHALYAVYSRDLGKFAVSGGLRAEQTVVDALLYDTNEEIEQDYLNLFPSAQVVYQPTEKHGIQVSYSRRIDRPGGWRLNPFADISDSLNVRQGNPNLQPELIHSVGIGHLMNLNWLDLSYTAFYRYIKGQIDYVLMIDNGISRRMPMNLNYKSTTGLEIIGNASIFEWWSLNGSLSLFHSYVDGSNIGNYTNSGFSWNTKFSTEFDLPLALDAQLTGSYEAQEVEAQGRDLPRYYLDASLARSFFNGDLAVNLTLQDMFNTRNFAGENMGEYFEQWFEHKRETRILLLGLTYKL